MATDPTDFTVDAFLCDSVALAEGKLYIQGGGWNMLNTEIFPLIQSRIGLGAMIGVPWTATNRNHQLQVSLTGDTGPIPLGPEIVDPADPAQRRRPVGIGAQFNVGRPAQLQPGDSQNLPFAVNFDQLQFPQPGSYCFTLSVDGQEINRLSFRVNGPAGIEMVTGEMIN